MLFNVVILFVCMCELTLYFGTSQMISQILDVTKGEKTQPATTTTNNKKKNKKKRRRNLVQHCLCVRNTVTLSLPISSLVAYLLLFWKKLQALIFFSLKKPCEILIILWNGLDIFPTLWRAAFLSSGLFFSIWHNTKRMIKSRES